LREYYLLCVGRVLYPLMLRDPNGHLCRATADCDLVFLLGFGAQVLIALERGVGAFASRCRVALRPICCSCEGVGPNLYLTFPLQTSTRC